MKKIKAILALLMVFAMVFNMCAMAAGPDAADDSRTVETTKWRLVDPANIELGRSYLIVSEYGALVNASARISTPGDVTGDTQGGMAAKPVTIADGLITSEVTADMIWQFGLGGNNAAASGGLGAGAGYYIRNDAPGAGGGTDPLRREPSMNAQYAPINTTNAGVNVNQQSVLMHVLDAETSTVSMYIWAGNSAWNFALMGTEDGFTAKSPVGGTSSAAQLLELLEQSPLWLYEPDMDFSGQHYVMASAGPNGSISPSSPSGHVWVNDGEDVTFTFTPAFGYVVDTVTVNGEAVAVTGNTYTIENVTASDKTIHVTFKFDETTGATDLPFIVYDDIFSIGNVTTAVIIDLGEGNAANLADVNAGMFTASTRNTRLNGTTLIYEGPRRIARAYVNTEPVPLGYISPAPGSDDLVTDTPASGRYIVIEFEFFDENGPLPGAMPSGGLQGTTPAIMNYNINATGELKLADGSTITPSFVQSAVVNPALDKFVPDKTNPGGTGSMDILISIDDSWEDLGPLPLFIYNHGGGRGGTSGEFFAPVQTANGAAVLSKLQLQNPGKYNAHIIATQNYASNQANRDALMAYVRKLADEGKVDLNRIYMSGFSAGSGYTNGFYTNNPEFLAAVVPISGGGTFTQAQLDANPEILNVAMWPHQNINDGGATLRTFYTTGIGTTLPLGNATVLQTNQAYNYPYYGFDWTPHEVEAQLFSNALGQSNATFRYGASQEEYADKNIFDWMFDQSRAPKTTAWRLVDPADIELGRSYVIVSEYGALANAQATISTPGDVTGDTQIGMTAKPVTIEDGLIVSEVTADMIWQFGPGANTAAASGGLGEGAGYYVLNDAPGAGGGTGPLRRESSYNAQHAPINTTNPAVNGNQQSMMLHVLDAETSTASLYIWGGNNQWNFALMGTEDGFTAKSRAASTTSAEQLLEQMQESPLWLYEPDVDVDDQHYVMATSGANGSISPTSLAGYVWVNDGEDVTFTFNPAFGFEVDKVTVNGEEVAVTGNTYTIENVTVSGTTIHVTFKAASNAADVPFTVYNDIFSVGNVTTAVIVDLGEGNAANLADVSVGMFSAAARNTRLDGSTVIYDGPRKITRVYVNDEPAPLGYISPAPGSDGLVTDTPASGRYIIVEFEFWDANGPVAGAMPSGGLQGTNSPIINYRVNANRELKLTDGSTITPSFTQTAVVNPALDKFVPDKTNSGGTGSMDILISIDDSWEDLGPLPLFIYNHGGGRGGPAGDYYAPVQTANGATVLSKLQLENPGKYNAHIIATQNYASNQANYDALIAYVKKLADEGKVDLNRIYMSGFSAGSGYTNSFYNRYPEFLAAIVPCGTGGGLPTVAQLNERPELAKTAIWAHMHKNDPYGNLTTWTDYFTTGAGASGLFSEINMTLLDTNQAFNFPYYGFDWSPHETEAQLFSNRIGQSNAFIRYGASHETYADKNIFDWMFDQSRAATEPGEATFDLLAVSTINRERVSAVAIDMGREISGSSLDLDTFAVSVLATNPRTGATIAASSGNRVISKVYVNNAPAQTNNPPASGQYVIIEMVYWGTDLSLTANDSITFTLNYTISQTKPFDSADGAVNPGDVSYIQGKTVNELLDKFEYGSTGPDGTGTPFRLFRPENVDLGEPQPLVLLLHGNGQGANDDETALRFQNNTYFAWPEIQEEYPSYVLIPSARPNEWQNNDFYHLHNLKNYIQGLIDDGLVDPDRVYITGASMGGRGTYAFIQLYPDFFAAAVPIAAENDQRSVENAIKIADLPIWEFITRGEGVSRWNSVMDFNANYSQYLNDYKLTIFNENFIPAASNSVAGVDWDMSAWPHAAWLMAYNVHTDVSRGGRVVDWMFAQKKNNDTSFDLLAVNTINRERIATVVIDMKKDVDGSSLDLDTFTVNSLATNPRTGATITASSGDRVVSKVYVNTEPETTANPPASGQYIIIELVYWGTDLSLTASDSITYNLDYTVTQNKAFSVGEGTANPGDINYKQRQIKNDLIDQFMRGYIKAPESATSTRYSLYSPEITSSRPTQRYPLVVLQHGGGQGSDNETHLRFQNNLYFAQPEQQAEFPCYVLMPANATNAAGFDNIKYLIDKMVADGRVDPDRIYITGSSMGGGATWNFIQRYPDYFAAAAPICPASGITSVVNAQALADLPIWMFVTRGDPQCWTTTLNCHNNYSSYLNNYKFTIFNENYIPQVDWDMSAWAHAAWLMAYEVHTDISMGGRLIDWMFAQKKNTDTSFDLLALNTINRERIATVVIDMKKDVDGSSLDLDTFTVNALATNPNTGATIAASSGDRSISKIYVNTAPETTANPPASGRYLIIELVYWGTDLALTASDSIAYNLDYTVTQNKAFTTDGGAVEPGDLNYKQRLIKNGLIDQFYRGYTKAPESASATRYSLYSPERLLRSPTKRYPLVILLHGSGQGSDNETQLRFQNNLYFAQPEQQAQFPSYVLIPAASGWGNTQFDNLKYLIDKMVADGRVDPTRIYVTGSSMGGGGTWSFINRYPDLFAAAMPICAGGTLSDESVTALRDLPIWGFVTRGDSTGLFNGIINTVNRLKDSGASNTYLTIFEENYIPAASNPIVGVDWNMSAWPHAAWLMAYNVHTEVARGGRAIDWLFAQQKSADTSFDLLAVNTINRERIATVVIDMKKDVDGSSLDLDTFAVNALATNPNTGATIAASSGDRAISKVYVNTAPKTTANPPASGQYIIIEMVYWGTDLALTASDSITYKINYTVTQNKAFSAGEGTVNPGGINYKQRQINNDLISQFARGYIKAPESATSTRYSLYSPEITRVGSDATKRYPLVILLHGGGQGSNDNETPLRFQNNLYFAQPEQQAQFPSYVLIPSASGWGNTQFDNLKYLIDKMVADGRVDPTRIYVTGSSMGGGGTWSFINRYPDLFAAAMPICAGGTLSSESVTALRDLPIWGFVTRGDSAGLFNGIINTINQLKNSGASNKYLTIFEENYIPAASNPIVGVDWNMSAWPHAAWLMAYNVHTEVARGGRAIDWLFAQQKSADTSFDLLTYNTINRERIATVVIDMRKDIDGSSLDLDTFTVNALATNPNTGATIAASSGDRVVSKVYVNTAPEMTANPPASGQYIIIEMVYWGTDLSLTASDSITYRINYTVTQNKAFSADEGTVNPGDINYKQRQIKNDLISQFARGYVKAPESATSTRYSLYSPEITRVGSDATKAYPLVVLQHGGGQGSDNETHLRFQNNLYFVQPEQQEEFPCYVLMPANATTNAGFDNIKYLIDKMVEDGRVDPDRIYITGSSMGGGATWNFIQRYPDLFAAAAPICPASGITSVANAEALADLPIWMFVTRGDPLCWTTTLNCHNTYGGYLNNYKLTIFDANYVPAEFNPIVGVDWDMTAWPHAAWLMAYNVHVDEERGRMIDWMFAQTKIEAPVVDATITSTIKTIVVGCAANLPADIVFSGEPSSFELGLYAPDGKLLRTISVSKNGRYMFKIEPSEAVAGIYTIKAVGSADGVTINCVAQPEDLWEPRVIVNGDTVTISFASEVTFNEAKKSVKIGGATVANGKVGVSGKTLTITGVTVIKGQQIVIAGVKYAELFPSYSFTFTLTAP